MGEEGSGAKRKEKMEKGKRRWRNEREGGERKEEVVVMVVCDSNSDSGSSGSEVIVIVAVIKVGMTGGLVVGGREGVSQVHGGAGGGRGRREHDGID